MTDTDQDEMYILGAKLVEALMGEGCDPEDIRHTLQSPMGKQLLGIAVRATRYGSFSRATLTAIANDPEAVRLLRDHPEWKPYILSGEAMRGLSDERKQTLWLYFTLGQHLGHVRDELLRQALAEAVGQARVSFITAGLLRTRKLPGTRG